MVVVFKTLRRLCTVRKQISFIGILLLVVLWNVWNQYHHLSNVSISFKRLRKSVFAMINIKDFLDTTSSTSQPISCHSCFVHRYQYVLNNANICGTRNRTRSIRIIIIIFTKHENFRQREALRQTWLRAAKRNTDTIRNLTLKTVTALKWASDYCGHAEFLMKTDDDVFVNTEALLATLSQHKSQLRESVGGYCWSKEKPNRQRGSKWYISYKMYPKKYLPGFCSGTGYVTSIRVAKKLYDVSKNVPLLPLEDVYIGLCLRALRMSVTTIKGFNVEKVPLGCIYHSNDLITSHQLDPSNLKTVWRLKCHNRN
ncbi:beta-1,3-galactosyltransferase 1-like [Crassostrea angulata]|uniref:beta-1,3-galactosyltransferase 1-like n=1 Tax=Magallana angulata TaxID=2784310 RepID=UPI0022B1397A|nr:beta-1,3-galactosyltransferase 1-like [Crassostrea angulata]